MNKLKSRKKGILVWVAAGSIVATMAVNVSISSNSESLSDLALANIEALARGEDYSDDCSKGLRPSWECTEWRDPYGMVDGCCGDGCFPIYDGIGGYHIGCSSGEPNAFCCYGK